MLALTLTQETIYRLKDMRRGLFKGKDNRNMVPVNTIIAEGCKIYKKNAELFSNLVIYYRNKVDGDVKEVKFRAETLDRKHYDLVKNFSSTLGLSDDSVLSLMMDCVGYKNGILTDAVITKIKAEKDILYNIYQKLIDIENLIKGE